MSTQIPTHERYDDEIDLFELVANLWQEKGLIIIITFLVTIAAVAYALLATPYYQAAAGVLPPQMRDIVELKKGERGEEGITILNVQDVYNHYLRTLHSTQLRNQFYEEVFYPSLDEETRDLSAEQLRRKLNEMVSIREGKQKELYEVVVTHKDATLAQEWANLYIIGAGNLAKEQLLQDRVAEIQNKQSTLVDAIEAFRKQAKSEREFEIARLEEALYIANAIGLSQPLKPEGKSTEEGATYVDRNLLYMRGADALTAQLEVLQNRENDDPFIPELAELTSELAFYNTIVINADSLSLYTFDAPAEMPETPIKPKKKLIVIIGFLLGGMLGVGAALVRIVIRNRKAEAMA